MFSSPPVEKNEMFEVFRTSHRKHSFAIHFEQKVLRTFIKESTDQVLIRVSDVIKLVDILYPLFYDYILVIS